MYQPGFAVYIALDFTGGSMGFWEWVALFFGVFIVAAIIQIITISNRKSSMETGISTLPDFNATQKFMGNNGVSGIAIDEERKKICLIRYEADSSKLDVFAYRDLLSSEIFEDGNTITSTSRTSQIGGALLGGLALGGVGAMIGGLSGKTTSTQKPKRIDLRITVNRTDAPIHDINFMDTESAKDGIGYTVAMQQARHWHGLIAVLIRRADQQDSAKLSATSGSIATSVSDEIRKLAQLRDEGLISTDEFVAQKARLLG
jgi:hypothetical protein